MNYDFQSAAAYFAAKAAATTGPHELSGVLDRKEPVVVIDVRFPSDFAKAHVPGAINLPKGKWQHATGLAKDRLNVLYCYDQTCHLAAEAARELLALGYPVAEMEGGFAAWEAKSLPVVAAAPKAA
jgi:rhodanese-related sulfurtransferase